MIQEKTKISRERRKALLKRLKEYIKPKKKELYLSAFFAYVQFLMRVASFFLIAQSFARFLRKESLDLKQLALLLFFFTFVGYLFSLFGKKFQGIPSQYARNQLKKEFFDVFLKREGSFEKKASMSDVLLVAAQGIDSLDTYYSHYLAMSWKTKLNCFTVFLLVLWLFPLGAIFFVLFLPLIPMSILAMQKRSQKIMQRYWGSYADVGNLFMDDLKGLNTLYSYQADEKYAEDFQKKAEEFRDATMELLSFQLQSVAYMDTVMYLAIGVAGLFALQDFLLLKLSLESFLFFVLLSTEFFAPLREQGYGMHLLMMNAKMADKIFTFLDSFKERACDLSERKILPFENVKIENLSFAYEKAEVDDQACKEEKQIFQNFSVAFEKGKLYVLAGESGLGKSTFAKILVKLLPLQKGKIFLGEQDFSAFSRTELLKEVVYLSANATLLDGSIYENLSLSCQLSKKEMEDFLKEKQVLSFVFDLPEQLDTQVGEKGKRLSPGQIQQILCLRAYLAKKSFYLLDEISSSLDRENEKAFHQLIDLLKTQAVVLEITHKMRRVQEADHVLFMYQDQGERKMVQGSPAYLMETLSAYQTMYETQIQMEAWLYGQ